ncbi:replication-relaxation family protein [Nocardioides sp.]|uniref:replication-relaxation family protein n=1 Tax=Nocardioides sp. TaxID=35761 RepID=UPI002D0218D0|nr:replication-relaxation family protein [Nocardioides sp.]HSX65941.1 replication-relaxation family protein [Nocardioides sp.]
MSADRRHHDSYTPGTGLPLGVPTGSDSETAYSQVSGEFSQSREPNTSAAPLAEVPSESTSVRIGHRMLESLDRSLSDRDRDVLRLVAEHRFLTTHQVQAFRFQTHNSEASGARVARRVLARLQRDGMLEPLGRPVGGFRGGSAATIWRLTSAGSRLVYGDDKRRRPGRPTERFLKHSLAIADVHVLLNQHKRIETIEDIAVQVEPASWRTYQGPAGERRWLQPDLYAEIMTTDFLDRHFIEVDLGTESLPTLIKKCQQYEDYRRSGVEQARSGSFPLVVWLFVDHRRAQKLEAAVRRSSKLTDAMYRYAIPDTLTEVLAGGAA